MDNMLDWEVDYKVSWVNSFYLTLKKSLTEPVAFYESVSKGNGLKMPIIYSLIVGVIGFIFAVAYQAGFHALALGNFMAGRIVGFFMITAIAIIAVIFLPVIILLGILINAGLFHLGLMIIGSARRDFASTFRVVCYATGPQILGVIPFLGSIISAVWCVILNIIGIKVVHNTSYGRSAFVVFLPLIICCGFITIAAIVVMGGVFASLLTR